MAIGEHISQRSFWGQKLIKISRKGQVFSLIWGQFKIAGVGLAFLALAPPHLGILINIHINVLINTHK